MPTLRSRKKYKSSTSNMSDKIEIEHVNVSLLPDPANDSKLPAEPESELPENQPIQEEKSQLFSRLECVKSIFIKSCITIFSIWATILTCLLLFPQFSLSLTYMAFWAKSTLNKNACDVNKFEFNNGNSLTIDKRNIDIDVYGYSECGGDPGEYTKSNLDLAFNKSCHYGKVASWLIRLDSLLEQGTGRDQSLHQIENEMNDLADSDYIPLDYEKPLQDQNEPQTKQTYPIYTKNDQHKILVIHNHGIGFDRCFNGYRYPGYLSILGAGFGSNFIENLDLLTFDYLGFGNSSQPGLGDPEHSSENYISDTSLIDSLTSTVFWAKQNLSHQKIILWAHSLGNAVALSALNKNKNNFLNYIDLIILDSPFDSARNILLKDHVLAKPSGILFFGRGNYEKYVDFNTERFDIMSRKFDNVENLNGICKYLKMHPTTKVKIEIFHSTFDKIIPIQSAKNLYSQTYQNCHNYLHFTEVDYFPYGDYYRMNYLPEKYSKHSLAQNGKSLANKRPKNMDSSYDIQHDAHKFSHNDLMRYGWQYWWPRVEEAFRD